MSICHHENSAGFRLIYFAREYASRRAITDYGEYRRRVFTYGELLERTFQTAGFLLDGGVKKGDAVMVSAGNSAEYAALVFAAAILGVRLVPVDVTVNEAGMTRYLEKVRPRVLVTSEEAFLNGSLDAAAWVVPIDSLFEACASFPSTEEGLYRAFPEVEWYVDETDVYIEIFTSGTTGEPKIVPLTHRNLISNLANLREMCAVPESYSVLSMAPLSHALGLTLGLYAILAYGAHLVLAGTLDSGTLTRILQQDRIDGIVTVPAFLSLMKEKIEAGVAAKGQGERFGRALSRMRGKPLFLRRLVFREVLRQLGGHLRWMVTGASPLDIGVGDFFEAIGVRVTEGYGLTECLMVCVNDFAWRRLGTVGKCLPHQQLRLDRNNEIWVAGPNVFGGYAGLPEVNREMFRDGWMRTGDIGRIDEDGHVVIVGRAKNVIIGQSGLNIYPEDIEAVVRQEDGVRECVVLNLPRRSGEVFLVAVLLTDGEGDGAALDDLRNRVNRSLGSHQRLGRVERWTGGDFPRTSSGKVKRNEMAARLATPERGAPRSVETDPCSAAARPATAGGLREMLSPLCGMAAGSIRGSHRLVQDLGLDSLGLVELITGLSAGFHIAINREDFFGRDLTVDEVAGMVVNGGGENREPAAPYTPSAPSRGLMALTRGLSRLALPAFIRTRFHMEIRGTEALEEISRGMKREGHLVLANHASHLDTPSIFSALPLSVRGRLVAAAASDYFFNPDEKLRHLLMAGQLRLFPLDRRSDPRGYFATVAMLLDRGDSVLLFPEGTRSRNGELGRFHPSVGKLVKTMGAPVIPVCLFGTHEVWPASEKRPGSGRMAVKLHPPISFPRSFTPYEIRDRLEALFQAQLR